MKITKFIFKIMDFDAHTITVVVVDVHSHFLIEWSETDDTQGEADAARWMALEHAWKKNLKEEVKKKVQEKHNHIDFSQYTLKKFKEFSDSEVVNTNMAQKLSDIKFREIYAMDGKMLEFKKGKKPDNPSEIFNYEVKEHYHILDIPLNDDGKFDLNEVVSFNFNSNPEKTRAAQKNAMAVFTKQVDDLKKRVAAWKQKAQQQYQQYQQRAPSDTASVASVASTRNVSAVPPLSITKTNTVTTEQKGGYDDRSNKSKSNYFNMKTSLM